MHLRRRSATVDEENPYWMSFSDIMSALLIIFILASVVLIIQLMEIQQELEKRQKEFDQELVLLKKAESVRRTILHETAEVLNQKGIRVSVSENDTVLSIPNEILGFDTGAYELRNRYQSTAREIGQVLSSVIQKEGRVEFLDTIFVEGHTDNRPLNGFMGKGNWGLSSFRAISLWQFWSSQLQTGYQLHNLVNQDGTPLFSVSGYAETRPVTEIQTTEDEYRQNRRIDIRFTIRRPSSTDYQAVKQRIGTTE